MEKEIKAAIITGVCGIIGSIITYNIGANSGNGVNSSYVQELQQIIKSLQDKNESLTEQIAQLRESGNTEGITQQDPTDTTTINIENNKINVFELTPFKEGRNKFIYSSTDSKDNIGNSYPGGYLMTYDGGQNEEKEVCYILDKKYSVLSGTIALSYNHKDVEGEVWVEFYEGDTLIGKTDSLYSGVRPVEFSLDVSEVSELTIHLNGGSRYTSILTQGFYLET